MSHQVWPRANCVNSSHKPEDWIHEHAFVVERVRSCFKASVQLERREPGVVAHAGNPRSWELETEDCPEFRNRTRTSQNEKET